MEIQFNIYNYKIKALTIQEDIEIQTLLMYYGCEWQSGTKDVSPAFWDEDYKERVTSGKSCCAFIITKGSIGFMDSMNMFLNYNAIEITIDQLRGL